jgi:phosphate transport system protein
VTQQRQALDNELSNIRDDILRMGSLVYKLTQRSVNAFLENDSEMARSVISADDEIDKLHRKVEQEVTLTVALQQPMASNLRYLMASILIANELERMADHAVGIARTVLRYKGSGPIDVSPLIPQMVEYIRLMIYESMDAFIAIDAEHARDVAKRDTQVDALYNALFQQFVERMRTEDFSIEQGTYILWTGHNLERIGDRATNICERISYASTGETDTLNEKP